MYLFRRLYCILKRLYRFSDFYILWSQRYTEAWVVYQVYQHMISSCGCRLKGSMWTYLAPALYTSMSGLSTSGIPCVCSRLRDIVSLLRTRLSLSFVGITRYGFGSSRIWISCLWLLIVELVGIIIGSVIHLWNFSCLQYWIWIVLEIIVRFIFKYACRKWVTLLY